MSEVQLAALFDVVIVMGSPLTMTATVCAYDGVAQPSKARAAAQPMMKGERRRKKVVVMIIFAISTVPS